MTKAEAAPCSGAGGRVWPSARRRRTPGMLGSCLVCLTAGPRGQCSRAGDQGVEAPVEPVHLDDVADLNALEPHRPQVTSAQRQQ